MNGFNKWLGVGYLADAVEYYPATETVNSRVVGRLICNRPANKAPSGERYDVIPFVAWGRHADNIQRFTHKGKQLLLEGPIRTRHRRLADGSWENSFELQVYCVYLGRDSATMKVTQAMQGIPSEPMSPEELAEFIRRNPALQEYLKSVANS